MTDLLKQLREPWISGESAKVLVLWAADEIERLRATTEIGWAGIRINELTVEIERLTRELEQLTVNAAKALRDTAYSYHVKVERLQAALQEIANSHGEGPGKVRAMARVALHDSLDGRLTPPP